jgi:kinetochore protein Mis13/DSN1
VIVKKPNPRNAANAAKIQVLEAQLKRYDTLSPRRRGEGGNTYSSDSEFLCRIEEEKEMWLALRKTEPVSPPSPLLPTDPDKLLCEIDSKALDSEQATILASLQEGGSVAASAEDCLKRIASTLEFTVDQFADGLHKLGQYHEAADRIASRVLGLAAERLDGREKATLQAAGTENMPLQDVLRSLARFER